MKRSYSQTDMSSSGPSEVRPSEEPSTEEKLAILASLNFNIDTEVLLDALLTAHGNVEAAGNALSGKTAPSHPAFCPKSIPKLQGYQSSLNAFTGTARGTSNSPKRVTKKGRTLHLYAPEDVAAHTPCSIIHNFLEPSLADHLLREMLAETPTYGHDKFMLFDNEVESPHTICFYVDDLDHAEKQKTQYVYNGSNIRDVRKTLPYMRNVSSVVQKTVNEEIKKRIDTHYPNRQKLRFQSPEMWKPNTSFVNCYDGGKESVGWHSDQLTYLGPRPVIGSISLGVAREFRVRRVVPRNTKFDPKDEDAKRANEDRADTEGQISIHLPHNSLLVMHAEMQEEWKHSIAPAPSIDPHPIAENKRINITYRCYRESFAPEHTPKCRCGVQAVLRCVQKRVESRGKYMWMCHVGYTPGGKGCSFFEWAKFNDDGEPVWWHQYQQSRERPSLQAWDINKPSEALQDVSEPG